MNLNLTGHHVDITESMRNYVDSKMERIVRHFDNLGQAHVILSVEKNRQKAEANIHVSGNQIFADSTQDDMYAAIDTLIDKLDRQVRKHKERLRDHHSKEAQKAHLADMYNDSIEEAAPAA